MLQRYSFYSLWLINHCLCLVYIHTNGAGLQTDWLLLSNWLRTVSYWGVLTRVAGWQLCKVPCWKGINCSYWKVWPMRLSSMYDILSFQIFFDLGTWKEINWNIRFSAFFFFFLCPFVSFFLSILATLWANNLQS